MLKKINRVKSRKEFEEIKLRGVMHHSPFFGLLIENENVVEKQFAFIISKKISKRAVDRNRIKRLLSESVRQNLGLININVRGVFLVKRAILDRKYEEVEDEVKRVFSEIK